jgi:ABC-type transport system involved in multi-copper enzyme maturation permease subunit
MIKTIIIKELQNNLYSLRFHISFLLCIVIFAVGTIAFLKNHDAKMQEYSKYQAEFKNQLKQTAESNAGRLAVNKRAFIWRPRENGFISDCKEKYFPNRFNYNAYNVFGFEVGRGGTNPFLNTFQELNWSFIASVILSFTVLLFTFDTISGEKETGALALTLSNSIPRATVLFGKYISAIITTMVMAIFGIVLSILIVLFSRKVDFTSAMLMETFVFLLLVFLFLCCTAAFGTLSSVIARKSNVSLLISLTFWLVFVVVIPNTAIFWANKIFSIEHVDTINEKINSARGDLNRNAPPGSWTLNPGTPFLPEHRLRADLQTKLMNAEMAIRNAYFQDMFRQLERTRLLTVISPVALFDYMNEAIVGGGYARFKKIWTDLHGYQTQFLIFFKTLDAADPNSPHWYNPLEDLSTTKKPIAFEQVPVFEEKPLSLAARFSFLRNYLVVMIFYIAAVFSLTFVLFLGYDVR